MQNIHRLRVGAARVDITPSAGTHIAGSGHGIHRPAEVVLDPLYARAVVFETGGRKLCIVSLDVTLITDEWADRVRSAAFERFGFERSAVMVHATQTHSAPAVGYIMLDPDFPDLPGEPEYLRGGERAYCEQACAGAIEAIGRAHAALRPATLAVGSAARDGLAFNRRAVMRNGKVTMPFFHSRRERPLGRNDIRYMEGPTDPEVGVLCARDEEMRMVALLLHFSCHPVNVYVRPGNLVSADWPGAWCAAMQEAFGAESGAMVVNGCCGNLNPWSPFEPDVIADHMLMGNRLAEASREVVAQMRFAETARLDWRSCKVSLPLQEPDPERLKAAEKMLSEHPRPVWPPETPGRPDPAWFRAASLVSVACMRRRSPVFDYEIQAFRIGDTAIVGLPGEPFIEGQLAIKIGSPAASTFVAHAANQYVGYVPMRDAYPRGGHEVDCSYWAKLAPGALEAIVDRSVALIEEMFA